LSWLECNRKTVTGRLGPDPLELVPTRVCPVVGRFVQAHPLQFQIIAVDIAVGGIEDTERFPCEVFRGGDEGQFHSLVIGEGIQESDYVLVALVDQECMVPQIDDFLLGDGFHVGKIHHHALFRNPLGFDDFAGKGDFQRVAVAVHVPALAPVIRNAVSCVEFESAGDEHVEPGNSVAKGANYSTIGAGRGAGSRLAGTGPLSGRRNWRIISLYCVAKPIMTKLPNPLTIKDHSRASAGLTYVYPVVSRRAGGVSVGVNLNPNNACNWRCIYCQVPGLTRGSAPPIDVATVESELRVFLQELLHGSYMEEHVPPEARRINDIALSGNGEPTSAAEFPEVIEAIGRVLADLGLVGKIKLVLITNGSLIHRPRVQAGLRRMAELNGEVWFKVDSATAQGMRRINNTRLSLQRVRTNLRAAAGICPTWLQTCVFALDGAPPSPEEQAAYQHFVKELLSEGVPLRGILMYGVARQSMQPEAARLSALPVEWINAYADSLRALGVEVKVTA
jgi:wyosine [tRNA(Phe)-imidazoG37] synthetase (radical SAM superfamily)